MGAAPPEVPFTSSTQLAGTPAVIGELGGVYSGGATSPAWAVAVVRAAQAARVATDRAIRDIPANYKRSGAGALVP